MGHRTPSSSYTSSSSPQTQIALMFLRNLCREFFYMKWHLKLCIILPIVRCIHIPSWDTLYLSSWPDYSYTEMWYFVISRMLEFVMYFSLSKITGYPLLLLFALLGLGKFWDESYTPFAYRIGELAWTITVISITYIQWRNTCRKRTL